jgi:hypothetical protein
VPTTTPLTSRCLLTPPPKLLIVTHASLFLVQRFGTLFVFGTPASVLLRQHLVPVGTGVLEDRHHAGDVDATIGRPRQSFGFCRPSLAASRARVGFAAETLLASTRFARRAHGDWLSRALSAVIDGDPLSAPRLACASRDRNCARKVLGIKHLASLPAASPEERPLAFRSRECQ